MTTKTLAAVVGTLAIIVVLFFITKITTPSRLVAKSGFFAGSSTDDWGRGTGVTGFWEPIRVEGRQEQMPQSAIRFCWSSRSGSRRSSRSRGARRRVWPPMSNSRHKLRNARPIVATNRETKTFAVNVNGLFVRSEAKEGRSASAAGRSMLSHDAGSVQRGTVLETRLVGLHVCSLPRQAVPAGTLRHLTNAVPALSQAPLP